MDAIIFPICQSLLIEAALIRLITNFRCTAEYVLAGSQLLKLNFLRAQSVPEWLIVKLSVFYFDDQTVLLDIFQEIFSHAYEVRVASTLSEARRMLSECRADIVVSDLSMPEISGVDFLREVENLCPDSYRIMLTGVAQVGDMVGEISSGLIHHFIRKPWKEEEMHKALERAALTVLAHRKKNG